MSRKKTIVKKIGCGLLVASLVLTGIPMFDMTDKAEASSVIYTDDNGTKSILSSPKFIRLRMLFDYAPQEVKEEYTVDTVYNHSVYETSLYEKDVLLGTDREGNVWEGDCVLLRFGSPYSFIYGGNCKVPVIVNVHCTSSKSSVTSGTLPEKVTVTYGGKEVVAPAIEIGSNALANTNIETINIPETYFNIADKAFMDCHNLKQVNFINEDGTVNQGDNIVYIGNSAFSGCWSLENAILPSKVVEVESDYNGSAESAQSYLYGGTTSHIGTDVFRDCYSLKNISIESDSDYVNIPDCTFAGCNNIENIEIKAKTVIIGKSAFSEAGSNGLKNLNFDCDLILGDYAFSGNAKLESVQFNGKVEFKQYTQYYAEDKLVYDWKESTHIFSNCFTNNADRETVVKFNGNEELEIAPYCFQSTGYLNKVVFSDKVKKITVDEYAFGNTGINNLQFSGEDVTVKANGLGKMSYTSTVTFNNTETTTLEDSAFAGEGSEVKRIEFNSNKVIYRDFIGTASNTCLKFGKDVSTVQWNYYTMDSTKYMGNVKEMYITSPKTKMVNGVNLLVPNEDYTIYGYTDTNYSSYIRSLEDSKVVFQSYIQDLSIRGTNTDTGIISMVSSKGFDEEQLEVVAKMADDSNEILHYSQDGIAEGYTLTDNTKTAIENIQNSSIETGMYVTINYADISRMVYVMFIPKKAKNFDVKVADDVAFVEGKSVSASNFVVSNVVYNDNSMEDVALSPEKVSVELKSGDKKLVKGTNTVIVSYNGASKEIDVTAGEKVITKLTAVPKEGKKFYLGDVLSTDDFVVEATYNNGEVEKDFKGFILSENVIAENGNDLWVVKLSSGNATVEVPIEISKLEVCFIMASYSGAGVMEGDEVKKSNVTVTAVYTNNSIRQLNVDEFDLVYQTIVANKENEVKIVYKEDNTKVTSIYVVGQKRTEYDVTTAPIATTTVPVATTTVSVPTATEPSATSIVPVPTDITTDISNVTTNTPPLTTNPPKTVSPEPKEQETVVPLPTGDSEKSDIGVVKVETEKATLGVNEKLEIKLVGGKAKSYISSDKKIATVSNKGIITAKKTGKVKIKVTDEFGKTHTVTITVKKAPNAKSFKASVTKKIIKVGKKFTIKVKFKSGYYSHKMTFTSSKKTVATVNSKGVVTAKKKGKTIITLKTYNGQKVKVTIAVK